MDSVRVFPWLVDVCWLLLTTMRVGDISSNTPAFVGQVRKQWCSQISARADNQCIWVTVRSIIRERSQVDCFSLKACIVRSLIYIYTHTHDCLPNTSHVLIARDDALGSDKVSLLAHALYIYISHANSFFFPNQFNKYGRQEWPSSINNGENNRPHHRSLALELPTRTPFLLRRTRRL